MFMLYTREPGIAVHRSGDLHVRSGAPDWTCECTMSTDDEDSYGDVIDQATWRLQRYLANPVVLGFHNSRSLPVGRAENVRIEGGALKSLIRFNQANPEVAAIYESIKAGFLKGVSVGFVPGRVDREQRGEREVTILRDCELYELSIVPIPANPSTLIGREHAARGETRSRGDDLSDIEARLERSVERDEPPCSEERQLAELVTALPAAGAEPRTGLHQKQVGDDLSDIDAKLGRAAGA